MVLNKRNKALSRPRFLVAGAARGVLLLAGLSLAFGAGAFSLREWFGLSPGEEEGQERKDTPSAAAPAPAGEPPAPPPAGSQPPGVRVPGVRVDYPLLRALLVHMAPQRRNALLGDAAAFQRFVRQEVDRQSLLQMALAENRQRDPVAGFLMRRRAEGVLYDYYLSRVVDTQIATDYPSEEQMREYYRLQKERFVMGRRVHLWQIFFPVEADADEAVVAAVWKQANDVRRQLLEGKLSFEQAVERYSKHGPSKLNGGYMRLTYLARLQPQFQKLLERLPKGELSEVARDRDGFHIVKRGDMLPARTLDYEQVRPRIRVLLRNESRARLSRELHRRARDRYPYKMDEGQVDQWLQQLRAAASYPAGRSVASGQEDKGAPAGGGDGGGDGQAGERTGKDAGG
ncbi:MAG: peptidylprolyl isomerase [Gammaproteobacteria bacterium]|nr:peptidylprolyl isomerase [Gammaproteobacteria bacterium]